MRRIALALLVALFAFALAGCSSSSSSSEESYGAPTGTVAADGTVEIELSGYTFTLPKGFEAGTARSGVIATNAANEQIKVYVVATDLSLQRMYEGEETCGWLKKLVDSYAKSTTKSLGKTSYDAVSYQDINGVEFAVLSGVADKDGTKSHVVVLGAYHEKYEIVVISVTSAQSDVAFDVAKTMK